MSVQHTLTNVIIIHGAFGNGTENWIPWLKKELEKREYTVYVPRFPTPENQNLDNWQKTFKEYRKYLDSESILIGHSVGATFILDILEKKSRKISAAFLVAGFTGKLDNKDVDSINKTFAEREFDWNEIKRKSSKFYIYGSDDDPYVPIEKTNQLAEKLGTEPIIVEGAGHFNEESDYNEFEDLLIDILSLEN